MDYYSQKERAEMSRARAYIISLKTWRRFGTGAFIIFSIAICCFSLALSLFTTTLTEKQQPYELIVTSEKITDNVLAEIEKKENVIAVTPVLEIPAILKIGETDLESPLQGIDKSYIRYPFLYGTNEQSVSAVPYLIINRAAAESLIDSKSGETPDILLSKQVLLHFENKSIVGRLTGIFDDHSEEPKVYIDLLSAKNLLLQNKTPFNYSSVYVRCLNAGKTESITAALTDMGLTVQNANTELEQEWSIASLKAAYLFIAAAISLLSFLLLMREKKKTDTLFCGRDNLILQSLGFSQKRIRRINIERQMIFILFSTIVGVILFLMLHESV